MVVLIFSKKKKVRKLIYHCGSQRSCSRDVQRRLNIWHMCYLGTYNIPTSTHTNRNMRYPYAYFQNCHWLKFPALIWEIQPLILATTSKMWPLVLMEMAAVPTSVIGFMYVWGASMSLLSYPNTCPSHLPPNRIPAPSPHLSPPLSTLLILHHSPAMYYSTGIPIHFPQPWNWWKHK